MQRQSRGCRLGKGGKPAENAVDLQKRADQRTEEKRKPEPKPGFCWLQPKAPGSEEASKGHFTEPATAVGSWATQEGGAQQQRGMCLRVIPTEGKGAGVFTHPLPPAREALLRFTGSQNRILWEFFLNHDVWVHLQRS